MYENVKSRVKFNNAKGEEFVCYTGVRQGECLSPFLFSMFVNGLEQEMISKDIAGLDLDYFKLFYLCMQMILFSFRKQMKVYKMV